MNNKSRRRTNRRSQLLPFVEMGVDSKRCKVKLATFWVTCYTISKIIIHQIHLSLITVSAPLVNACFVALRLTHFQTHSSSDTFIPAFVNVVMMRTQLVRRLAIPYLQYITALLPRGCLFIFLLFSIDHHLTVEMSLFSYSAVNQPPPHVVLTAPVFSTSQLPWPSSRSAEEDRHVEPACHEGEKEHATDIVL